MKDSGKTSPSPDTLELRLQLEVLDLQLTVCKCAEVPRGLLEGGFCCIARTADEISVVCETTGAPDETIEREDGWRGLKVRGPLDFGLVGIMARISSALAGAGVPLFAISTYDTDYVLVKEETLETAISALRRGGCLVDEG